MSRSFHQNKSRRYWRQHGPHGDCDWAAQLEKSRIKRLVRVGRNSPERVFSPIPPEAIQYSVEELRPSLFFPATLDDVKGVMSALPPGFLIGVRHVRFLSGREYINAQESVAGQVYDPILKRKSIELEPGVYAPIVLGSYCPYTGDIQIFAYARDPAVKPTEVSETALKLYMLETLLHELAHNQDISQRPAGGRWHMRDTEKAEEYATRLTGELFRSVVIPYVSRVYGPASSDD